MAYTTVTLRNKVVVGNQYGLVVEFTGDAGEDPVNRQINVPITSTVEQARKAVHAVVNELNARTTLDSIPIGTTITAPTPPTPDTVLQNFQTKLGQLRSLVRAADLGLIATDDSRITTVRGELQTAIASRQNLLTNV